jgi:hypothetical protein
MNQRRLAAGSAKALKTRAFDHRPPARIGQRLEHRIEAI